MKRTIRLTESDLHRIIRESVKKVLIESKVVTVGEYEIKFDDDNRTILSVNGWSVRDQKAAIRTMGADIYNEAIKQLDSY